MVSLQRSNVPQINTFNLSFDIFVSFVVLSDQKKALIKQNRFYMSACHDLCGHQQYVGICLYMSVGICVCGLHASVRACVQTVMVPPSENRWVFLASSSIPYH